jgi:hypothetical protein
MQKRKHTTQTEGEKSGREVRKGEFVAVNPRGGAGKQIVQQQEAAPVETTYERQMRLMREIGEKDRLILAALAK